MKTGNMEKTITYRDIKDHPRAAVHRNTVISNDSFKLLTVACAHRNLDDRPPISSGSRVD